MSREEALKLIKETPFDMHSTQDILCGLNILAKYDNNILCSFEHDQMWASDFDETVSQMTEEEVRAMATHGWLESEDSWSHF